MLRMTCTPQSSAHGAGYMGSSRGDYDAPTPSTGVGTPRYNPQTPAAGTPAFPAATPGFENDPPTFAAPTPGAATPYGAAPTPGGGGDYAATSSGLLSPVLLDT